MTDGYNGKEPNFDIIFVKIKVSICLGFVAQKTYFLRVTFNFNFTWNKIVRKMNGKKLFPSWFFKHSNVKLRKLCI